MKLDTIVPMFPLDRVEVQKKQRQELTLLGKERRIKGLRLYEYDKDTKLIAPAEYQVNEDYVIGQTAESKVHVKPGCIYVQAMNEENAMKKIKKILNQ